MRLPKELFLISVLGISTYLLSGQADTLTLNDNWQFREARSTDWMLAQVPGTVQEDLIRLDKLPDPFLNMNEDSLLWVEEKDWVYITKFNISKSQLDKQHHLLRFQGLDTYAEVFLNGNRILNAENMFRTWEVDVGTQLKSENELKIYFHSPIKKGKKELEKFPYGLPAGNDAGKIKVAPVVRKAAFHFGWDWGPRIVAMGIWRPIELISHDRARITEFQIKNIKIGPNRYTGREEAFITAEISLKADTEVLIKTWVGDSWVMGAGKPGKNVVYYTIPDPELWWPNGLGQQKLYTLHCQLGDGDGCLMTKKVGIRSAELINKKDSLGTSFYFKINKQPVFAKGANYIPQRHFTNSLTKLDYRKLLMEAAESGMNMIRVWGGGIYEEDYFYELCDSLGLMVWQDFMCANTMYPPDEDFTQNLLTEVEDNVKRLGHHPSIVHWCGNNEIDVAWHNWGWQKEHKIKKRHQRQLKENYDALFKERIPTLLYDLIPEANYSHTSPLSNWGTDENFNHSSMHYWGVFHGEDPFEDYGKNIGRFNSEYGFQSFPNTNIMNSYFAPDSFDLNDPILAHRQKSYKGNRLIYKHIADYHPEPQSLVELSYLSQLTQARGISTAIQQHRMDRPRCMGSLYWQLNDCWPAVSWSSIDFDGQKRALQYQMRNNMADQTFFLDTLNDPPSLVLINDKMVDMDYTIKLEIKGEAFTSLSHQKHEGKVAPGSIERIPLTVAQTNAMYLLCQLKTDSLDQQKIFYLNGYEDALLSEPEIQMDFTTSGDNKWLLKIKAKRLIRDLYLYSEQPLFLSENFLDILPEKEVEIFIEAKESFLPEELKYISRYDIMMSDNEGH